MFRKIITYTDYEDQVRTTSFYFNLTKTEITKMELGTAGGLKNLLEQITNEHDTKRIVELLDDIVRRSYGVKSLDGNQFIKSAALTEAFFQTAAYDEFFMELISDSNAASAFIRGIVPQGLVAEATEQTRQQGLAAINV